MAPLKSQVAFAASLYHALWDDLIRFYPELRESLALDLQTLTRRLNSEGITFVTRALPELGKAFLAGYQTGKLELPPSFKTKKGENLPMFLNGLVAMVFLVDGTLRENPVISAVADLHQITAMSGKLKLPYTPLQEEKVISDFIRTESELYVSDGMEDPMLNRASSIVSRVFSEHITCYDLIPRHGPGAVATGESNDEKWRPKRKFKNLHREFGYYSFFWCNSRHLVSSVDEYRALENRDISIAKIRLVPKDSKGPRLISMEPLEVQYCQQSVMLYMYQRIENHRLTRGHVNFSDQTTNGQIALEASFHEGCSTLDMKEASDRVSVDLVKALFSGTALLRYLLASRSDATELPNGTVLPLRKFAPMGSAVCFPVESLVFYALAVASIVELHGVTENEAREAVYVYGDDLIVETRFTQAVLDTFPRYGLKFNPGKCFVRGPFRESCGVDAFLGRNITPVRWRTPWQEHLSAKDVVSLLAFSNLLYERAYMRAASFLKESLENSLQSCLPVLYQGAGELKSPIIRPVFSPGFLALKSRFPRFFATRIKWDRRLQRPVALVLMLENPQAPSKLTDWWRLLPQILGMQAPNRPSSHARLKRGWSASF